MIATLRGIISEKHGDMVIVDCGGVGYGALVSNADSGAMQTGSEAKLYVYEQIKEDAHDLYGFRSLDGKQLFQQLISVKNVGPKVAMSVLNIGSNNDVRSAIASGDVKRLQTAKGVGKRAAEQMVVELRDKIGAPASDSAEDIVTRAGVDTSDEAVQALMSLGYSDADASLALKNVDPSLSVEERITAALKGGA